GLFIDGSVEIGLTSKRVAGVPPVPGYLALLSIGYQFGFDSAGKPQVVERVVEKERVVAAAPKKGAVRGIVKDASTGKPIADAVVTLPGRNRLLADASGSFAASGVDPGVLDVGAEREGYAHREIEGSVTARGKLDVNLLLPT